MADWKDYEKGILDSTKKKVASEVSGMLADELSGILRSVLKGSGGGGGLLGGLSGLLGGGAEGGLLGGLLGGGAGGLAGGLGGLGGLLSGVLGFAGPLLSIASMFGVFGKGGGAVPQSGVKPLFTGSRTIDTGGLDALRGSDIFGRAAFSSRNVGGAMLRKFAEPRLGGSDVNVSVELDMKGDAGRLLDAKWTAHTVSSARRGIPNRTGFDFG